MWAQFAGGSGTIDDPYQVSNANELSSVRTYPNSHFRQIADIDLNVYPFNQVPGWQPITFNGYYDGANHQIANLLIVRPGETCENALFTGAQELKNLTLEGVNISGGSVCGALCSSITDGVISNCTANGTISGEGLDNGVAGGLVGVAWGSLVLSNCVANITINSVAEGGGLVGKFASATGASSVSNCSASGSIRATTAGGVSTLIRNSTVAGCATNVQIRFQEQAGGIFAHAWGTMISLCHASGSIISINTYDSGNDAGGLIGRAYGCQIVKCYATSYVEVHNNGQPACGGLVGYVSSEGENGNPTIISRSYAHGDVLSHVAGGLVGQIENTFTTVTISDCFATGNVTAGGQGGGFVGQLFSWPPITGVVSFVNCYCTGDAMGTVNLQGGFGGYTYGENVFTDCYWNSDNSSNTIDFYHIDLPGITPKTTGEMTYPQSVATFATWDFATIWSHDADFTHNNGYPYLETEAPGSVAAVSFNPPAGSYHNAFYLTLDCATEYAHIYYTMDGSDPDETSTEFNTQLVINHNTTVKARAYRQNWQPSEICTAVYSFPGGEEDELVPASRLAISAYPNPFREYTTLAFSQPKAEFVMITLYNIKGQLVRELFHDFTSQGEHNLAWDGKDIQGSIVPTGIYFARYRSGKQTWVKKIARY